MRGSMLGNTGPPNLLALGLQGSASTALQSSSLAVRREPALPSSGNRACRVQGAG